MPCNRAKTKKFSVYLTRAEFLTLRRQAGERGISMCGLLRVWFAKKLEPRSGGPEKTRER